MQEDIAPFFPKIVLIGMSGAGKSTVGKMLAKRLQMPFLDLDKIIEEQYKVGIPRFLQKYGEKIFRQCEYQMLLQTLEKDCFVLATGGGSPCFFNAMQHIKQKTLSIYIYMPVSALFHRITKSNRPRPLVFDPLPEKTRQNIKHLLQVRDPIYCQAHEIVNGENGQGEQVVSRIITLLTNKIEIIKQNN
ncbi:MAG: shikimate kinase [Bacteroidales bacterium]|jgi:shikimate kinase|nr:shikimate kinase [Bacteroidales bacterium]